MPPVSVELKKQVKAANDIVDVIATYIPVLPAGKALKAVCPFHNDTRPSLQIDRHYQNFRCWSCDARGDVFDFVMKFEKIAFPEALHLLARRAGIALDPAAQSPHDHARARMLDAMKWAEQEYTGCLLDDPTAEEAREYLGQRRLSGATVRKFGLGYAPLSGEWLTRRADEQQVPFDLLTDIGLLIARDEGGKFFDRFRDRVMFPIRDVRGQAVGFGGRVLPGSPLAARGPKYYNSADTPLFNKSDLLYGLDLARHAGSAAGFLAVVEGYTDVMMAHQCGVANVVAPMGTALTARHVAQLRRYVPKVVLVFDADDGGNSGVDRALELFIGHDAELAIATLPDGLDPCDLLVTPGGPEAFKQALAGARDALEFKLNQLWEREAGTTVEGQRRIVDTILGVMALAQSIPSQAVQVRQELIVSRLAHRIGLRQETVWARFAELKATRRRQEAERPQPSFRRGPAPGTVPQTTAPADFLARGAVPMIERQLLELLLADPDLVPVAVERIKPEVLKHAELRRMLSELYALHAAGMTPDLDALRVRLIDRPDLAGAAMDLQNVGRHMTERGEGAAWLDRVLKRFAEQTAETEQKAVKAELTSGPTDPDKTNELLYRLMGRTAPGRN
ncbi:DNA primase [Fimbriiglobus ruber]|uniref:DNA primase n=1 Tax=Fimbriiglobus ruber TaxID=1908690 RepID=A0A225E4Y1_9BACT|nr:DNA primase [Fimbriiglobus ruber]OWK43467.1 DNA primase [Fimbriiglobus ruber]